MVVMRRKFPRDRPARASALACIRVLGCAAAALVRSPTGTECPR